MPYVPITIRIGNKLAKQEGRKEGRKEGKTLGISIGEKKGKLAGKQEGKKESAREIAVRMLKLGMDLSTVAKCSGLKKKELESLLSQPVAVSPDRNPNP